MKIAAFSCFPFAWDIFFNPLTFSLYVSLGLKSVSCRQHNYGSCFCIHSASLCVLVGPFIFKIIIDIYVPMFIDMYMNHELPDVQAAFRKGRGTKNQIANIGWH